MCEELSPQAIAMIRQAVADGIRDAWAESLKPLKRACFSTAEVCAIFNMSKRTLERMVKDRSTLLRKHPKRPGNVIKLRNIRICHAYC